MEYKPEDQLKELLILNYLYQNNLNKITWRPTNKQNKYMIHVNNKALFKVNKTSLYKWIRLNNIYISFMYKIRTYTNLKELITYLDLIKKELYRNI